MTVPNNKFWIEFIDMYQNECDELWNPNNVRYNNKGHRCKAWAKLTKKLKEIDESATVENARRRINSMRSCFRRELLRGRRHARSGAGTDYVPTLWYYDKFHFLTNVEEDLENAVSDEETAAPPPRPKKRKYEEERRQLPQAKAMKLTSSSPSKDRDEADVFAECWAVCYRKLTPQQQIFAKKAIDDIFVQGRLGNLTLNSFQPPFEHNIPLRRNSTSFGQNYYSSAPSGGQPYLQTHFAEIHLTESPPSNTGGAAEPPPAQNGINNDGTY